MAMLNPQMPWTSPGHRGCLVSAQWIPVALPALPSFLPFLFAILSLALAMKKTALKDWALVLLGIERRLRPLDLQRGQGQWPNPSVPDPTLPTATVITSSSHDDSCAGAQHLLNFTLHFRRSVPCRALPHSATGHTFQSIFPK